MQYINTDICIAYNNGAMLKKYFDVLRSEASERDKIVARIGNITGVIATLVVEMGIYLIYRIITG